MRDGRGDTTELGLCRRRRLRYDLAISFGLLLGGTTKDRLPGRDFDSEPLTPDLSPNK